jgi:hypothetical protein
MRDTAGLALKSVVGRQINTGALREPKMIGKASPEPFVSDYTIEKIWGGTMLPR